MTGQSKIQKRTRRPKWVGLFVIVVALTVCEARAEAQPQARIPKIGWLSPNSPTTTTSLDLLLPELRKLGYIEGKNIAVESRYAEGNLDRLPALANELARLQVDIIVAGGLNDSLAAKKATRSIPIVFLGAVADPVASGLVDSLARPGGNITGFTTIAELLAGKRLELLKDTIPKLSRVAVLWDSQGRATNPQWTESQHAAAQLGVQLHSMEVRRADQLDNAFKEAIKARCAALGVTQNALASNNQNRIVELATKNHLPTIYYRGDFVENGGLMSYGADSSEAVRRGAVFIDKILKGAKPADLPIEQPRKFGLIINLKAAKQIGLTIPPNVLARADKVIR